MFDLTVDHSALVFVLTKFERDGTVFGIILLSQLWVFVLKVVNVVSVVDLVY